MTQAKITTIKLDRETKQRLEHLRLYRRESYDEILQRVLDVLNILRSSPERARASLMSLERQNRRSKRPIPATIPQQRLNTKKDSISNLQIKNQHPMQGFNDYGTRK